MRNSSPCSRALRKGRFSETGRVYLTTTVTLNREPVFNDLACGRIVVNALRHVEASGSAKTLAFVVMPDHLHWLLQLGPDTSISRLMQNLKGFTSRKINLRLFRKGGLWQPGFHDRALRDNEDPRAMARYIVANPLRAELVSDIASYPHWDAAWLRGARDDELL